MEPMSIRLDPDLKADLQELADADERSLNSYINRALRRHVETVRKRPKAKRKVRRALDAAGVRFIDADDVGCEATEAGCAAVMN